MERAEPRTVEHLGAAMLVSVGSLALLAMFATSWVAGRTVVYVTIIAAAGFVVLAGAFMRAARRLRLARARDAQRLGDLEALVGAAALLQGEARKDRIGDLVARLATAVLHGGAATVLLGEGEDRLVRAGSFAVSHDGVPDDGAVNEAAGEALERGRVVCVHGLLCFPLIGTSRTLGCVVMTPCRGREPEDAFVVHIAQLFGSHAGLALERLDVIDELATLVVRDPLTGVGNRRHATSLLESLRPGDAVLLVDIDGFKQVNDRYGHSYGDEVLAELGRFLREHLRQGDSVARYGGEEFLVVLHGVGRGARAAARRLIEGWRDQEPPATLSAGYAIHEPEATPEETFEHADGALYRAKAAGRDRVSGYESGRSVEVV